MKSKKHRQFISLMKELKIEGFFTYPENEKQGKLIINGSPHAIANIIMALLSDPKHTAVGKIIVHIVLSHLEEAAGEEVAGALLAEGILKSEETTIN